MTLPDRSDDERRWGAWARTFVVTLAATVAGYLAIAYAIDPYDSGRSRLFSVDAVRPQGPRTAAAVRGRDPAFQGAIFGNSHIQTIEPGRLSRATGIPFLQMSIIATGPGEQFVMLGWYLRHHPAPRALVVSADAFWCTDDPTLANEKPFPFWLFADGTPAYLRGTLRWSFLEETLDRIGWLLRKPRATAPRDGWWDTEQTYLDLGYLTDPHAAEVRDRPAPDAPEPGRAGPAFPAADRLAAIAARLPAETALVLVFPPIHAPGLPRPGTPRARAEQACKSAITGALAGHRKSAVVDWRRDSPEVRDPSQFFDQSHYRHVLARRVGDDIADALNTIEAGAAPPQTPRGNGTPNVRP